MSVLFNQRLPKIIHIDISRVYYPTLSGQGHFIDDFSRHDQIEISEVHKTKKKKQLEVNGGYCI